MYKFVIFIICTTNLYIHLKKDSTPYMRFASSKRAAKHTKNVEPLNYENDLIKRKDGNLDMRFKINKQSAQLPRDSNGDIIEDSSEAISFRAEHSLNLSPQINFDFNASEPIIYTGPVIAIQKVFQT